VIGFDFADFHISHCIGRLHESPIGDLRLAVALMLLIRRRREQRVGL